MKTKKTIPGISRATQKTFIIIAIAAYLLETFMSLKSLFELPDVIGSFTRWFPVYLIDAIILPLVLFVFAFFVLNGKASKVSRTFKATLVSVMGSIVSMIGSILFTELFKSQLGYGGAVATWDSPWVRLIPTIVTLAAMTLVTVYVLKPAQKKEFTTSRPVQKTFIAVVALAFVVNAIMALLNILSTNEGLFTSMISIATFVALLAVLYMIASKTQTKLTRLFNALLYMLIAAFISSAVYAIMYTLNIYMHEQYSFGSILWPTLTLIAFVAIVVIEKRRSAF